jgi:hypothetical protein
MFLGKLLARLGRLADLLPNALPLVVLVLLDGRKQGRFLGKQLVFLVLFYDIV